MAETTSPAVENEEAALNSAETWRDLVTVRIPGISVEEADYILWEETAFPMADRSTVESQINTYAISKGL